jgi:hypothetical protein
VAKLFTVLPATLAAFIALAADARANQLDGSEVTKVAAPATSKEEQQKLKEHNKMRAHINKHVKYPASKADLLKACKGMSDVKASDKEWFEKTLPEQKYDTAADVEKALGWEPSAKSGDAK